MQPFTGPYVYGVNRRSDNFLFLSDLLFVFQFYDVLECDIYRLDQN